MKILPFDLERDFDLYLTGDTEAFSQSFPGLSITPDIRTSIESGINGLPFAEGIAALTLVDEKPIGFVVVSLRWFYTIPQGYIESIFVHPDRRGSGARKLLIDAAKEWSCQQGARSVTLDVSAGNTAAIEAYRSSGFAVTRHQMESPCSP